MQTPAVYVISLEEESALHDLFADIRSENLEPTLFNGIRGSTLSLGEKGEYCTPMWAQFGPHSAIGCGISHMGVWEEFLKSDSELAVVFEDDVVLEQKFRGGLTNALQHVPQDFDVLYLGSIGDAENDTSITKLADIFMGGEKTQLNEYIQDPRLALALHAYVITRRGAEKMLQHLKGHMYFHIDYCMQMLASKGIIKRYVAHPRLAYQTSIQDMKSTNVSMKHPTILTNALREIPADTGVNWDYFMTVSIGRIGDMSINGCTLILFIIGILLACLNVSFTHASILYLILSSPDLQHPKILAFHYAIFILPILIRSS
jgi:GR25 family glycosyltransferase involved in LPS biosynthesis